jgi:YesN/AraC family two-component response regulator
MNHKYRILLVEDDLRLKEDMMEALNMVFTCEAATYVDEAFTMLSTKKYDLIVTDLMLPGKTGFDFLRTMQQNPDYMEIPIMILSALSSHDFIQKGFHSGAIDYMVKPFSIAILIEKIKAMLHYKNILEKNKLPQKFKLSSRSNNHDLLALEEVIANVYDNPKICTKDIAERLNTTVSSLNRTAKKLSGSTATKLLINHRLNVAKMLLEQSKLNITEIAYQAGFGSPQYFCTLFKKRFKVNPKDYRSSSFKFKNAT